MSLAAAARVGGRSPFSFIQKAQSASVGAVATSVTRERSGAPCPGCVASRSSRTASPARFTLGPLPPGVQVGGHFRRP